MCHVARNTLIKACSSTWVSRCVGEKSAHCNAERHRPIVSQDVCPGPFPASMVYRPSSASEPRKCPALSGAYSLPDTKANGKSEANQYLIIYLYDVSLYNVLIHKKWILFEKQSLGYIFGSFCRNSQVCVMTVEKQPVID